MPVRRCDDLSRSLRHEGRPPPLNPGDSPRPARLRLRKGDVVRRGAICESGYENLGDFGALEPDAYVRRFGERPGRPLALDEWTAALRAAVTPRPEALALAAAIGRQFPVAVLTNNNLLVTLKFDTIFADLRTIFGHRIFVSAEFAARKPVLEVYRRRLDRMGAAPDATRFVDDSANNVAGAECAGLVGHVHTGAPAEALKRDGLLRESA